MAGQGGNSNGNKGRAAGLVATALGLSLVVGGLLNQGRQAAPAAPPSAAPLASDTHIASRWDFREDRRAETPDVFIPGMFTYREDLRSVAPVAFVADQFTYREDRRAETRDLFVADQFTYREDRRER